MENLIATCLFEEDILEFFSTDAAAGFLAHLINARRGVENGKIKIAITLIFSV